MNANRPQTTVYVALFLVLAGLGFSAGAFGQELTPNASTSQARRLIEDLRADLRPVDDQIRNSAFVTALENHQVSLASLRAFAGDQYNILKSDLRSNAHMVSRFGAGPNGAFFRDLVTGEAIAIDLMLDFAAALGMSEQDLQAYEPRPGAQTYPSYAAWLAFYGSQADIAAAYLLNFPVFGANTGRMAVALRTRYGFSAEATAFFDFFAELPPTFEPNALAVIQEGLDHCASTRDIRRSARLLQAYEKNFWDTVGGN
jgi:pyrroloquinoline quinone (PQQ) biosynthesis protein C